MNPQFCTMWGGRFTGKTDPLMMAFNASISFDQKLAAVDLKGSIAYVVSLQEAGLIDQDECSKLISGLNQIAAEWTNQEFKIMDTDEDIHSANERRLEELIGPLAGKLHTGRSRNDQVATDIRLWMKEAGMDVSKILKELISTSVQRAQAEIDVLMPGYTHLQKAQPIRWSHYLMSFAWLWKSDHERLQELLARCDSCPLGSGALAGNPFGIDRFSLSSRLGFSKVIPNSLIGVSDRDFIVEFLSWASLTITHLSRWAEDLIIYSSGEFGFVTLSDAYSTGSSLMPQKKNPDSLELIRGKTGRIFGSLAGFLMTYKALPSTYNKDLQEDKEPLFDAVDTIKGVLLIATGVISTLKINPEKMKSALTFDMLATDLAEYLVRKGIPFRETHHIAGAAVALAEKLETQLNKLDLTQLKTLHPAFEEDVQHLWDFETSVENRNSYGGTAKARVLEQITELTSLLK